MLNSIANAILLSKNRRQTVKPSPTAVSTTKSGGFSSNLIIYSVGIFFIELIKSPYNFII